jgi:hypothetical protein
MWKNFQAATPKSKGQISPDVRYTEMAVTGGVPGKFCTRKYETNWYERSLGWHEGRSIHLSRS